MSYNPATDFLGLWRNSGGNVSKLEMPGLDYVISALARAGIINLTVSATAPVANQSTTAWLRAAVPPWSAEGAFFLWDKVTTAYLAATPKLFLEFLEATASRSGVSWWTSTGGAPLNTVGNNGDFAIRLDTPFGIYGPKAAGAWPADPIPGTADVVTSTSLDNAFGDTPGDMLTRGATEWEVLPLGHLHEILIAGNAAPDWDTLTALMDIVFSSTQGSILYRGAAAWNALTPGANNLVLTSHGAAADPTWTAKSSEFSSGVRMVFHQTSAPTGWTKDVTLNDYGLRVVSGAVGTVAGTPFSTVFAQTTVGNHTLTIPEIPAHDHDYSHWPQTTAIIGAANFAQPTGNVTIPTGSRGGGGAHNHTVNLTLSYTDVIIAQKD